MSFTHSFTALLISLMATLTACSTGGGTQEPVPVGRPPSSASVDSLNASDAVACAYNATPFSPTTKATTHARLELEHYDDCAMDTPDRAAAHHSDDPHQGSLDIFAFEAGGYWIGHAPGGTSLTYTISVPKAGFYDLTLRVRPPSPLSTADALITLAATGRDTFVTVMGAANRKRRIFIDFHRNARTATAVAAYSLRARPHLPAATPVAWNDLDSIDSPVDLNYSSLPTLLTTAGDPWFEINNSTRDLPA